MKKLEDLGLRIPEILLPKNIDLSTWSVIACDQYTQDKDYWKNVEDKAGNKPSLGKRFSNMRKNWETQGQLNDLNNAIEVLYKYVNSGKLNANLTVAQLFGKEGKNGKMGQYLGNLSSQITRRGGKGYNARNKQNLPQQPQQ